MSDHDNIANLIAAGKELAGAAPRVTMVAHPDDADTKVPVVLTGSRSDRKYRKNE